MGEVQPCEIDLITDDVIAKLKLILKVRWDTVKSDKLGSETYLKSKPDPIDNLFISIARIIAEKASTAKNHFKLPAAYLMPTL